jgi:YbbR domain-containing protein
VTVEGPKSSVDEVARVIGYVGLSGNKEDFNISVPLTAVNSDGREVEDVRVTPKSAEASVQLARGLSKKVVEIKPVFSGELPAGYVLDRVRIDPSKIEIAGASTILDSLTAIDTEKIPLATETKSFHKEVQLELPEGVTVTNKKVNVNIDIAEKK